MSLSLKIDDQRKATGELELFYAGSFNPFDQARRNTQDWLKGNIPEIIDKPEIKSFHVLKLWPGETGTHFQCSFEGNVKQDTVAASLYSLQLPLCPGGIIKECDFPATSHRNLPVMLKSSGDEKVRIEIEYPEAWAAVFIPSNEQATNEFWNYSKTATHEKNKITFSRNLAFLKNSIPAEDYNELADLWHSCSGENDNRVVFRTDQAHK
jgi:hypothetical protein